VYGELAGRGFAAHVDADRTFVRDDDEATSRIWSATSDEELLFTFGSPPRVNIPDWSCATSDPDEPPIRGWIACGGSDAVTVTVSAQGEVFMSEFDGDPMGGLWLASPEDVDRLVVAGLPFGVVVAGPLGQSPDDTAMSVWESGLEEWFEVEVGMRADAWVSGSEGSGTFAGHRAGLPVLSKGSAPEVLLDPRHPMVDVMHDHVIWESVTLPDRVAAGPCLAVQAAEGIQLWLSGPRGWTMLPGPPGLLAAARLARSDRDTVWCLADDRLWTADLSAAWRAIDRPMGVVT
jgi:hypothetical protein